MLPAPTITPGPSPTVTETLSPMQQQSATVEAASYIAATATVAQYTEQALAISQAQAEATLVAAQAQADAFRAEQTRIVAETRAAGTAIAGAQTQAAVSATQAAQATLDERAWLAVGWTATADAAQSTQAASIQGTQVAFDIRLTEDAQVAAAIAARASQEATEQAQNAQATLESAYIAAESTAVAAEAAKAAAGAERGQKINAVLAWVELFAPYALGIFVVAIVLAIFRASNRNRIIAHDQSGAYPIIESDGKLTHPDRMVEANIDPRIGSGAPMDVQARITENAQKVDAIRMMKAGKPGNKILSSVGNAPAEAPRSLPPASVPWAAIERWDGKSIPLGAGKEGLISLGANVAPHLLVAGTTGSGKTRCGLRPAMAAALARGDQAIILDRSGNNFSVFEGHPNAHLTVLDEPEQAIGYLRSAYTELQRRLTDLNAAKASTWERAPQIGPRVWIVMDEFSNLADELDPINRNELWRWTRMVAAQGRQGGIYLALALQDPTAKSIDLRIRRNCTRVAFKVQDLAASQVVLGAAGAESLPPGHFMTVLGSLIYGVGFDAPGGPSDEALTAFLGRSRVLPLPEPAWLKDVEDADFEMSDQSAEERIRSMARAGASIAQICREVYGYQGGAAYEAVRKVLGSTE
jgi:hypothetical protein